MSSSEKVDIEVEHQRQGELDPCAHACKIGVDRPIEGSLKSAKSWTKASKNKLVANTEAALPRIPFMTMSVVNRLPRTVSTLPWVHFINPESFLFASYFTITVPHFPGSLTTSQSTNFTPSLFLKGEKQYSRRKAISSIFT